MRIALRLRIKTTYVEIATITFTMESTFLEVVDFIPSVEVGL